MIDGSYPPHRTQENQPSTRRSAGTSECAVTSRVPADVQQEASPEEEPFEMELVVPESPTAQNLPGEEQQQSGDHDTEDKTDEENPPPSDTEAEKMYRDADEVESIGAESPNLTGRLWALLEHLGITTAPWYRIKEVPRSGRVEFKVVAEIFFGSRVLY
jgi:hypothetical protein